MPGYPVVLLPQDRLCVVIGSGRVAEGKVERLLEAGARVRVIAPEVEPAIRRLAEEGRVEWVVRAYRKGDLAGAFLAIAATEERSVNAAVFEEAEEENVLVNAVDDVEHCTFTAPAILRNGDLLVAVSTEGKAPALAVRIRDRLREAYGGEEYARLLELAGGLRDEVLGTGRPFRERADAWYRLVDSEVVDLLRSGRAEEARVLARECLDLP